MKHELYLQLLLNPKNISVSQDFNLRARATVSWWSNQDQERGGGITDFPAWSMAHNILQSISDVKQKDKQKIHL